MMFEWLLKQFKNKFLTIKISQLVKIHLMLQSQDLVFCHLYYFCCITVYFPKLYDILVVVSFKASRRDRLCSVKFGKCIAWALGLRIFKKLLYTDEIANFIYRQTAALLRGFGWRANPEQTWRLIFCSVKIYWGGGSSGESSHSIYSPFKYFSGDWDSADKSALGLQIGIKNSTPAN